MATLPAGLTQADIDRYAQLDKGIKALSEEHAVLNETIKQAHKDAGIEGSKTLSYPSEKYGVVIVKLGQQKRFEADKASETFPSSEFPEYYSLTLDQKKMPADIAAAFRTNIIQTLSVSVAE
jgi:hypothetical protein